MAKTKERILSVVLFIYVVCFILRFLEYFLLRTDETFWGEAFIHKLLGIVILFAALKIYGLQPAEIGFAKKSVLRRLAEGVAFGLIVFVPAYFTEIIIAAMQGSFETLAVYVSAYSVNGTIGRQTGLLFFLICIAGNIINVIMEEGLFRGFFQKMLERKHTFLLSATIASSLFGLWHIMAPVRSYCDGTMSRSGFIANAVLLVTTSALVGFKFALMTRLTDSLYMAMGHHFTNNAIVNMLHVVSSTGTDSLMIVRISIAQSISFIIVWIWYMRAKRSRNV